MLLNEEMIIENDLPFLLVKKGFNEILNSVEQPDMK
jgi:hypothetical protein